MQMTVLLQLLLITPYSETYGKFFLKNFIIVNKIKLEGVQYLEISIE
jgi:hypothetical protein